MGAIGNRCRVIARAGRSIDESTAEKRVFTATDRAIFQMIAARCAYGV